MTFEVTRQAEIRNSCALISSSDGLLLTATIWMSNSGGLAITGQFVSVGAMMQSNSATYALIAVPLMIARMGSLFSRAFFKLFTYNAPMPSAVA